MAGHFADLRQGGGGVKIDIEPAILDLSTGILSRQGRSAQLRVKQSLIMDALLRAYPRAVSPDGIMASLYSLESEEPAQKIVHVHISLLRKALRESGIPLWIETRYKYGWTLSYSPPVVATPRKQYAGRVVKARAEMLLALLRPNAGTVVPTDEVLAALCISRGDYQKSKAGVVHHILGHLRKRGVRVWHAKCGDDGGYFLEADNAPKLELVKTA